MPHYVIPYKPRYPHIHKAIDEHRFLVLVAHRRFGKTVTAVNQLLKDALRFKRDDGMFAYVAPFRNQAKSIAWNYAKRYSASIPDIKINESELSITYPNGSTLRLFGGDNPDNLRGMFFDEVIIDEVAQIKPELWTEIVRPALADRKGKCIFLGTPKGVNLFSQIYDQALKLETEGDKDWKAMIYSVYETKAIDADELESLKKEMSQNEFRQEFLCDFAAASDDALIPIDLVRQAKARYYPPEQYDFAPIVMGVDVARFGSDSSVVQIRQGLNAMDPIVYRGLNNMELADRVAFHIDTHKPAAVFIDSGAGAGVIDRLRQLRYSVIEVPFGGQANKPELYANRRIEMWDACREWLDSGGKLPSNITLESDLCAPTYGWNPSGKKILESKDRIKERIGRSPDLADALCLTFAAPVGGGRARSSRSYQNSRKRSIRDPYA